MSEREPTRKKYVVHPGWITSKNDGDRHFVSSNALVRLYGVNPSECMIKYPTSAPAPEGMIHLYPDYSGEYLVPGSADQNG